MTLDLVNPKEFEILCHMCEAYLMWFLYRSDIIYLLIGESDNLDMERIIERYYNDYSKNKSWLWVEEVAESMAHDLWTLQQKIIHYV